MHNPDSAQTMADSFIRGYSDWIRRKIKEQRSKIKDVEWVRKDSEPILQIYLDSAPSRGCHPTVRGGKEPPG